MKTTITAIVFVIFAAIGCAKEAVAEDRRPLLKIVVKIDGTIYADGVHSTTTELSKRLDALKEKDGLVWFYRARRDGKPHPISDEVLKLIAVRRLKIGGFEDEGFKRRTSRW
jgi:hypothetical protein